jgi:ABC-type sugar transport system ATPase subunit
LRDTGADILLEVDGITKTFGQVTALRGVSLRLRPGRVHAVLGENGAGKSTLMKIISGVYAPTSGTIRVDGEPVTWARAEQARSAGISTIFQEFILLPNLSVAENLFLGREPRRRMGLIDHAAMRRESRRILDDLGLDIDPALGVTTPPTMFISVDLPAPFSPIRPSAPPSSTPSMRSRTAGTPNQSFARPSKARIALMSPPRASAASGSRRAAPRRG